MLVWLVLLPVTQVIQVLQRDPAEFKRNLSVWMKASVAATESVCQASVRSLPRRFDVLDEQVKPLGFNSTERRKCMYDGASELCLLEGIPEEQRTDAQKQVLETNAPEDWLRPCLQLRDVDGNAIMPAEQVRLFTVQRFQSLILVRAPTHTPLF